MEAQETIKLLQKQLFASRQDTARFQFIFKSIPDAVVFTDLDRRIVMVNPALENIFGYQEQELIGKQTETLYVNKEEYEKQGKIRFHLTSELMLQPYEVMYRKKDGTLFLSETVGTIIKGEAGETIGFIGLIRDVTDRKKAEDSLRELELMYRTIANFTYDWELWTNLDSTFRYVSPSCKRITGYTNDQFIRNPNLFREIIVPEDRMAWDDHHHDAKKEHKLREIQFRIKRRDGTIGWIEHACQPVIGPLGKMLGFRASNRDITERKKVEQELRCALDEIKKYKKQFEEESACLRQEINLVCNYKRIIGNSNVLQYILFKIEQIAATDTSVIIFGETGTGKELIARAIHEHSLRKERPMLTINCAALPAELIESELFGHEKGAFTGAHARQAGRFETADGTSLFLDEIGELPVASQAKLLRVLQDGEFERLGSSRTSKVDVRIIAATNRDLEEDVRQGKFRQDLWYRLNVFPITVPPLRERLDDIPQLLEYFLDKFCRKQGKVITSIGMNVLQTLQQYNWPGNIRELENIIERAVITTTGSSLFLADELHPSPASKQMEFKLLAEVERDHILEVLEESNWKVSGKNSAAEILGLKRSTLRAKMDKLNIHKP